MKKIGLLVVTLLLFTGFVDATEVLNISTNNTSVNSTIEAPSYWQGWAKNNPSMIGRPRLYITVYRSPDIRDDFYAVATKIEHDKKTEQIKAELIVKSCDPNSIAHRNMNHFVTYDGLNFYFWMQITE